MSVERRVAAETPQTEIAPVRLLRLVTVDSHVGLEAVVPQERLKRTPELQDDDGWYADMQDDEINKHQMLLSCLSSDVQGRSQDNTHKYSLRETISTYEPQHIHRSLQ